MIGDIAHVCNRGVDKRKIFNSERDYARFRDNLFLLNNVEGKIRTKHKDIFKPGIKLPNRTKLVEILKWSLMPNHYHLLLQENVEGGISEFIRRLGNAYTKYFNLKNNHRSGYLFQNRAKIIFLGDERHFSYIPIYIDLNPADLTSGNSKEKIAFIKSYEWSSLKNYYGWEKDEEIINKPLFVDMFGFKDIHYEKDLLNFINDRERLGIELEALGGVDMRG